MGGRGALQRVCQDERPQRIRVVGGQSDPREVCNSVPIRLINMHNVRSQQSTLWDNCFVCAQSRIDRSR